MTAKLVLEISSHWASNGAPLPQVAPLRLVHEVFLSSILSAARRRRALGVLARHQQALPLLLQHGRPTHAERALDLLEPELQCAGGGLQLGIDGKDGKASLGCRLGLGHASVVLCL